MRVELLRDYMYKKLLAICIALMFAGVPEIYAQMSDNQIISYIKDGVKSGKSEKQIGNELLSKGVSVNQIKRLVNQFKSERNDSNTSPSLTKKITSKKKRSRFDDHRLEDDDERLNAEENIQRDAKETRLKKDTLRVKKPIYGHNVFRNRNLSFEPNENMATPENYVLGPGDEVIIDIYGVNEASIVQTITPEGVINVSQIGPISLSGLTIKQASDKIRKNLSRIYAEISSPGSGISVTLGSIRSIQINVLGEVNVPGTYRLSAFTTLFNAIYRAGGVTEVGSLRNVKIMRGGKEYTNADIYRFLFDGASNLNISLKEGDVIIVPPYESVVSVEGGVKRPMRYEIKAGESISDLMEYAGGFTGDANAENLLVMRKNGVQDKAFTVSASDFASFRLQDCDSVVVSRNEAGVFSNLVEVKGAVYRPGKFEIGGKIRTVTQLIEQAGGCLDDAYLGRAQLVREKKDRTLEMKRIPLGALINGLQEDILLRKNDVLIISSVRDIEEVGDLSISGFVRNPGKYEYAEHTTVHDLVMMAGGFAVGASKSRVEISRRINNPDSNTSSDTIAVVFNIPVNDDGLMNAEDASFELQPYDVVAVRKSPSYVEQKIVSLTGEVTYPGQYTLTSGNERISDLIKRAGGPTVRGSLRSGMLRRQINEYERMVRQNLGILIKQKNGKDSLDVKKLKISEIYSVGVEIDKAVEHPGSAYDLILRDGDEIVIPATPTTIRVQGEVLFPNTVQYIPGKSVKYYINQAGGFNSKAKRSQLYVLHLNGTVSVGMSATIDPGCEIVVPGRPEGKKLSTGEWVSISTSAASIATMVASIINLTKK